MPEFLVIGGQRCGTTSLYRYLAAHPQVRPASGKELQFFSLHHARGERWYRAHFPVRPPELRSFEASPYYLFDPATPARAAAMLPGARFVALIRDPAERAYSHYLHSVSLGVEPLSFADALAAEPARLAAGGHDALRRFSYVARGRYAGQLTRWVAAAGHDRVLAVRTEDLTSRYADILGFLGLDPAPVPREVHTRRPAGAPPFPESLRPALAEVFAEDRAALAGLNI